MKIIFLFLFLNAYLLANCIDLEEEMFQNFVLETKKISIPNFPYAFNPSIIRWNGAYLMSFRAGKDYKYNGEYGSDAESDDNSGEYDCYFQPAPSYSPNRIGLIWLDDNFSPTSLPQLLNVPNHNSTYRQQDPRLIVVGDKIFITYSDFIKGIFLPYVKRMVIAELHFDGKNFYIGEADYIRDFENVQENRWEKNWVPFVYENELLLAYSIDPHKIMYPLIGTGLCSTIAHTKKEIGWNWGELRGGTPALLENDEEYLSFFHSSIVMDSKQSNGKKMQHYFMGAYTFSTSPPFEVRRISPSPIVGKNFYNGPKYTTWKPLLVVFPCGFVSKGNAIFVVYGRQDHEIWIAKLDKKKLLDSLVVLN